MRKRLILSLCYIILENMLFRLLDRHSPAMAVRATSLYSRGSHWSCDYNSWHYSGDQHRVSASGS